MVTEKNKLYMISMVTEILLYIKLFVQYYFDLYYLKRRC